MIISDIIKKFGDLKTEQVRVNSIEYDERVIFGDEIEQWHAVLTECLGDPVKSSGEETSKQEFALTVNFGGLCKNQTLYHRKFEEHSIIAMVWPWNDKIHVTLKIAKIKEQD